MAAGSWVLTVVGWFWILAGSVVTISGLMLVGALFFGRGVPVSGAGMFILLTLVVGPLLALAGPMAVVSAVQLMNRHAWARSYLEVATWIGLFGSVFYLGYTGVTKNDIFAEDIIRGAIFFLFTGAPLTGMLFLLRSDSMRRAIAQSVN
jgi:hypothetical protein